MALAELRLNNNDIVRLEPSIAALPKLSLLDLGNNKIENISCVISVAFSIDAVVN